MILRSVIIDYLLDKDGALCQYCQLPFSLADPPTLDHKISQKAGGPDTMDNLQMLHKLCNTRKGSGITHKNAISTSARGREALAALALCDGNKIRAAKSLNISLRTFYRWYPHAYPVLP